MRSGMRGGTLYRFKVPARPARRTNTRTDHGARPSRPFEVDGLAIGGRETELLRAMQKIAFLHHEIKERHYENYLTELLFIAILRQIFIDGKARKEV
jgi:hypothetical protein